MQKCYINVQPKFITDLAGGIIQRNQDSVLVMPVIRNVETYSPSKKKRVFGKIG